MFDYDIEPIDTYKDNPRFKAVKVHPGTGRYHTLHQARTAASGRGTQATVGARYRNTERNLSAGRRMTQRIIRAAIRAAKKRMAK